MQVRSGREAPLEARDFFLKLADPLIEATRPSTRSCPPGQRRLGWLQLTDGCSDVAPQSGHGKLWAGIDEASRFMSVVGLWIGHLCPIAARAGLIVAVRTSESLTTRGYEASRVALRHLLSVSQSDYALRASTSSSLVMSARPGRVLLLGTRVK